MTCFHCWRRSTSSWSVLRVSRGGRGQRSDDDEKEAGRGGRAETDLIWPVAVGWWPRVGLRMPTDLCWRMDDMVCDFPTSLFFEGSGSTGEGKGKGKLRRDQEVRRSRKIHLRHEIELRAGTVRVTSTWLDRPVSQLSSATPCGSSKQSADPLVQAQYQAGAAMGPTLCTLVQHSWVGRRPGQLSGTHARALRLSGDPLGQGVTEVPRGVTTGKSCEHS